MAYIVDMDGNKRNVSLEPEKQPEPETQVEQKEEQSPAPTSFFSEKRNQAILGAVGVVLLLGVGWYLYNKRNSRRTRFEFY